MFMLLMDILVNELCSITEICHYASQKQTGVFFNYHTNKCTYIKFHIKKFKSLQHV